MGLYGTFLSREMQKFVLSRERFQDASGSPWSFRQSQFTNHGSGIKNLDPNRFQTLTDLLNNVKKSSAKLEGKQYQEGKRKFSSAQCATANGMISKSQRKAAKKAERKAAKRAAREMLAESPPLAPCEVQQIKKAVKKQQERLQQTERKLERILSAKSQALEHRRSGPGQARLRIQRRSSKPLKKGEGVCPACMARMPVKSIAKHLTKKHPSFAVQCVQRNTAQLSPKPRQQLANPAKRSDGLSDAISESAIKTIYGKGFSMLQRVGG